ncbi:MAG TPA: 4Fe-4S dicluster domain-containing protein [Euryarchaeota archaeon]|nr:4Fe-4S dicluster domain-containing protein [Euryarchaeota archaeon]
MKITVFRYNPQKDNEPRYEDYVIREYEKHMKIIDALNYVNSEYGANIAFRSSCRAGQCGSCALRANKKPVLACRTDVEDGILLEPLRNFPVIKDLAVATQMSYPRIRALRPFIHRGTKKSDTLEPMLLRDLKRISKLKDCIECYSCMSVCPVFTNTKEFAGPLLFRILARFHHDVRDNLGRLTIAVEEGLYLCTSCGACLVACPEGIDTNKEIEKMQTLVYESSKTKN